METQHHNIMDCIITLWTAEHYHFLWIAIQLQKLLYFYIFSEVHLLNNLTISCKFL